MIDRRLVLVGLGAAALPATAARAESRWAAVVPVPWPVQEVYGAAWRGRVAIAGGLFSLPGPPRRLVALDRFGLYDPAADRWSEGPRLPFGRHHPSVAAVGDRLFVLGGYTVDARGDWNPLSDVVAFDGEAWAAAPAMPRPQCEAVALTLGERIHVVSGRSPRDAEARDWNGQLDVDLHQVFDVRAGRWTTAAPCPQARDSAAGGVIDGKLYLAAGRVVRENSGRLDRYDPQADRWETLAPMPRGAGGVAAGVAGGKLYVFGGEILVQPTGVIANCWSYDPARDAWNAEPDMPTPRHGLAGVGLEGRIYAVAGGERASGGKTSAVVEALVP